MITREVSLGTLPSESNVGVSVDEDLHIHQIKNGFVSKCHDTFENDDVGTVNVHFVFLIAGMRLKKRIRKGRSC